MSERNTLTIGKLAILGGVNVQTIRFYERSGLLPKPPRTSSGYRQYGPDAIRRLRFIKQAQVLGFSLTEIDELLSLRRKSGATCSDVLRRTRQKIVAINDKVKSLRRIITALTKLSAACGRNGSTSECPMLDALESGKDVLAKGRLSEAYVQRRSS